MFPEKTEVFPVGQKIGTIFWEQTFRFVTPKGGLHPVAVIMDKRMFPEKTEVFPVGQKIGTIFWEQTFRFVTPKGGLHPVAVICLIKINLFMIVNHLSQ
jgi:hypothetical protein